ncbi:hypothetical protein [Halovenus sp. HT40]|uniref:hypothetical protein n=1 Tax=Halovenus sp. HT40 TaxID=3126691 RepID=UPI00300F61FF
MTEDGEQSVAEVESDESEAAEEEPVEPIASPPDTDGEDEGEQFTAVVREVEEVPASNVPTDYPAGIDTAEAVAVRLTVRKTDEPVFVLYFEPTDRGPDDRLARLLAVAGVASAEELVDRELILTISEGYYAPVVPDGEPRGTASAVYGIFAGLAPSAVIGLVGIFSPGAAFIATTPFVVGWLAATFLLLPLSIYLDALNLRTTTNWTGGPQKWAVMAALPGLNIVIVPLYLIARENADQVA